MVKIVCIIFLCIISGCSSKSQNEEYIPVIDKEIMPLDDAYEEIDLVTAGELYEEAQTYLRGEENFIFDSTEKCFRSVDKGKHLISSSMNWHFENYGKNNQQAILNFKNHDVDFSNTFYYKNDRIYMTRDQTNNYNINLIKGTYDSMKLTVYNNTIFDRIDKSTIKQAFSMEADNSVNKLYINIYLGNIIDFKFYKTNILNLFGPDTYGSTLYLSDDTINFEFTIDSKGRFLGVKYAYQVNDGDETLTFVNELSNFRYNTEKLVFPEGMEEWPEKGDE